MRLHRFRIRTLMIVVAVVALMLGAALWVRRENERRELARRAEFLEGVMRAYHPYQNISLDTWLSREPSGDDQEPGIPPDPPEPK